MPFHRSLAWTLVLTGSWAHGAAAVDRVVALTTDFSTGSLSTVEVGPPWAHDDDVRSMHPDAVMRIGNGRVFVVNRFGADNIHVLDPEASFATVRQFSTGAGSNPQDIVLYSEHRAFVPRYDRMALYEVDPVAGAITDSVSFADLADADGIPEMSRAIYSQGRVFVAVQRLDRNGGLVWPPVPPSYLAVVDPVTTTLVDVDPGTPGVQGVELAGLNPFTTLVHAPNGDLLVGNIGEYGILDGGIERVDPGALESAGWMIRETTLGGDLLAFALADATHGFAIVSDASFNNLLVAFNPATGAFVATMLTRTFPDGLATDLLVGGDYLFVGDRSATTPGVRVFDVATRSQVTGLVPVGLPPNDLELLDDNPLGTGTFAAAWGLRATISPNPARAGMASVRIEAPASAQVELGVYDVVGREVSTLGRVPLRAGQNTIPLDLSLPAGVYWLRAKGLPLGASRFQWMP